MEKEKIIIVHLNLNESDQVVDSKLKEIEELARSANCLPIAQAIQNADSINPSTYIGSGKAREIRDMKELLGFDAVIFNNELTGSQMKNLEDIIDCKIVDRTGLILDIFARRARTREAKLQVGLAQLEYRLPRLLGFRNYLSREGAGIGTRGPGEQKLETDRRTIQREISRIRRQLKNAKEKRMIKSNRRRDSALPIVSLIGYSNVGKSTILNALTEKYSQMDKKVYSDDLLFATLDVSARKIKLDNDKEIIVTDTVGFVSDLPTKLIESFKGSLEEIEISDLLVVVVDANNKDYESQIDATRKVLKDMDIEGKKILYCFNKIDLNPDFKYFSNGDEVIYISAKNDDVKYLAKKLEDMLYEDYDYHRVKISYENLDSFLKEGLRVFNLQYTNFGLEGDIYIKKDQVEEYGKYLL